MRFSLLLYVISCLTICVRSAPIDQRVLAFRGLHELIQRTPVLQDVISSVLPRTEEITIQLQGHEFHLEKYAEQGNSGSPVYTVKSGDHKGSFAKTGYSNNEFIATDAAKQVITHGRAADGKEWMIIKKSEGMNIRKTSAYNAVKHDRKACVELLEEAAKKAAAATKALNKETGWDQHDPNTENVLFDDHMTKAYLIDWGMARKQPIDETAVEQDALQMFKGAGLCSPAPPPPRAGRT